MDSEARVSKAYMAVNLVPDFWKENSSYWVSNCGVDAGRMTVLERTTLAHFPLLPG